MKMIRDIEAALKYAELQLMLSTNDTKTRCFKTIISALRAELDREKNPLTCEGCKWEFNRSLGSADMCYNCNRMRKKDRYEPKGERDEG